MHACPPCISKHAYACTHTGHARRHANMHEEKPHTERKRDRERTEGESQALAKHMYASQHKNLHSHLRHGKHVILSHLCAGTRKHAHIQATRAPQMRKGQLKTDQQTVWKMTAVPRVTRNGTIFKVKVNCHSYFIRIPEKDYFLDHKPVETYT